MWYFQLPEFNFWRVTDNVTVTELERANLRVIYGHTTLRVTVGTWYMSGRLIA
jgi:hypothetical protein